MSKPNYDWFIHNWPDSAQVQLLDQDAVFQFRQKVQDAAQNAGRSDADTLFGQCLYRALYEQDRFAALTTILDDIKPAQWKTDIVTRGRVTQHDRCVGDSRRPFAALGISGFWVAQAYQHNRAVFDRFCDYALSMRCDYVRWFGAHDWPGGSSPTDPNYWEWMHDTVSALWQRGLRSQITLATRRHMITDPNGFATQWGQLVESIPDGVICCEMANEWNHDHNGWDDHEVRAMGDAFAVETSVLSALSAPSGVSWHDDMEPRLLALNDRHAAPLRTVHYPRRDNTDEGPWRSVRQPWHTKHYEFVANNEPARWDKTHGNSIEVAVATHLVAWVCGCAMSCHHDKSGVHLSPDVPQYPDRDHAGNLATVWSKIRNAVPADVANWTPTRVGGAWNGPDHPFPSLVTQQWTDDDNPDDHGVSRSFVAVRDDQFVMVLTGVRRDVTLDEWHPWKYQVYSLRNGERVYDGRGSNVRLRGSDAFLVVSA